MSIIAGSHFLDALGWALLGSFLPFAFIAIIYQILVRGIKNLSSIVRHNLALYGLFIGTLLFFYLLYAGIYTNPLTLLLNDYIRTPGQVASATVKFVSFIMPFAALLYLGYGFILFMQFGFFVKKAGSNQLAEGERLPAQWRSFLQETSEQLGIPYRKLSAICSLKVDTPQVIGFFKPIILIPVACFTQLNTQQLEAVLLHELVHIKRRDYAINICISLIEMLFFFNPFVKQLVRAIRIEREFCCDDMVLQFKYPAPSYAAALLTLEKSRNGMLGFGIAAAGKDHKQLLTRIERVLGKNKPITGTSSFLLFLLPIIFLGFIAIKNTDNTDLNIVNQPNRLAYQSVSYNPNHYDFINLKEYKESVYRKYFINNVLQKLPELKNDKIVLNEIDNDFANTISIKNEVNNANKLITSKEIRDYSFRDQQIVVDPNPELKTVTPYVPSNNFDYQIIEDSSSPKIKSQTQAEKQASEALARAKKGLENIDWKALEKKFKDNKEAVSMLKADILNQLAQVNWNQINQEVDAAMAKSNFEKLKELELQKQTIQQFQLQQSYIQAIQKKLQEQQQWIKENDERMKKAKESLEKQEQLLQDAMKKKRIIYI